MKLLCRLFGHKVSHSGATDSCVRCDASRAVRPNVGRWVFWTWDETLGFYVEHTHPVQRPGPSR